MTGLMEVEALTKYSTVYPTGYIYYPQLMPDKEQRAQHRRRQASHAADIYIKVHTDLYYLQQYLFYLTVPASVTDSTGYAIHWTRRWNLDLR
jgi:hypothetical protein